MKPQIKISHISDLQDARYIAAVGFEYIGFRLSETDGLPPAKIREIVAWLSGPKIVLEYCGRISDSILAELQTTMPFHVLENQTDFNLSITQPIWQYNCENKDSINPTQVQILKVEEDLNSLKDLVALQPDVWVHCPSLAFVKIILKSDIPVKGIYIGSEGHLPEGGLDYEQLDEIAELLTS